MLAAALRTVLLLSVASAPLAAQGTRMRPREQVPLVEVQLEIDGLLGEEAWEEAVRLDGFTEVEPVEGAEADPSTEILLMRDATHLYIGIIALEPDPGRMVLQSMNRDATLRDDDRVEFILDTFRDSKTAYFFQISAAGSRGDALLSDNGAGFNKRWDAFWEARTQIHENRWTAEIAVPFRTLAFGEDPVWRANFERYRGADRSRSRWTGAERDVRLTTVSEAGELGGFEDLSQGLGLEFAPFYKLRASKIENPDRSSALGSSGGELNWKITPQLTGSFTLNTDFAETESDARRVNTSRFPLFFPEKRDFFLEDSNLFAFGDQQGFRGGGVNVLPFFSRRIGLSPDGAEIPIEGGARLAGRAGPLDLGLLAVSTGDLAAETVPDGELFVARPSLRLSDEVSVGGLFTYGDPATDMRNQVSGLDFRLTSTDLLPGNFSWNTWVARSDDEALDDVGYGYGSSASLRTSDWSFRAATLATQKAFDPALGFVRRSGQRRWSGQALWEPRPEENGREVRKYIFSVTPTVWTDLSGNLQSYSSRITLFGLEWHDGDEFSLVWAPTGDRPDDDFEPVDNSTIRAGDYDWQTLKAEYEFSEARPLSGEVSVEGGSYYDGDTLRLAGELSWRPSAVLRLELRYRETQANLPGGDFTTRVTIFNGDVFFSPEVSLENLVQFDNESDVLGLQSRLRWILEDGREFFLVVNSSWDEQTNGAFAPENRDITVKAVYALRF